MKYSIHENGCLGRYGRLFSFALLAFILIACQSTSINNSSSTSNEAGGLDQHSAANDAAPVGSMSAFDNEPSGSSRHAEDWGVKVIGLRPSAAGYMLDFRYRILDAKKAAKLVNRKTKTYLIVEKDGSMLRVPVTSKLGPLRQSAQYAKENRNYFMFFANPKKHVKSGDLVTVVIGDFKAEHLVVN